MAQKISVLLIDDIDGSVASRTVNFTVGTTNYEIDLSDENAKAFYAALEPWTSKARKVARKTRRPYGSGATPPRNPEMQLIREWARANGYKVNERGRISAEIQEAYYAAKGN